MPKLSLTFYQSCVLPIQSQIQKNFSFLLKGLAWNAIFVNAKIYNINIGEMTCFEPTNRKISMVLFNCLFFALSQLINDHCEQATGISLFDTWRHTEKTVTLFCSLSSEIAVKQFCAYKQK